MSKISVVRSDMSISKIIEKINDLEKSYETAKMENDELKIEEIEKEFSNQKLIIKSSKSFFEKNEEENLKNIVNTSSNNEKVKRAKWILSGKKEYTDNQILVDRIIKSSTLSEASKIINENKEKKPKMKKRSFKKVVLIGITIISLGGILGCNIKKNSKKSENNILISTTETTTESFDESTIDYNNDKINVDESYKNLDYRGNGENVDTYKNSDGIPSYLNPGKTGEGKPVDGKTEREVPNVSLPKKPEDKENTEIIPEKTPNYYDEEEKKVGEDKQDNKKQDPIEKEEFEDRTEEPDTSYDPGTIEEDTEQDIQEEPDTSYDPDIIEESNNEKVKAKYIAYRNILMSMCKNNNLDNKSNYVLSYSNTKKNI